MSNNKNTQVTDYKSDYKTAYKTDNITTSVLWLIAN